MKIKKYFSYIPIESLLISMIVFISILSGIVFFVIMPKSSFSEEENRALQKMPSFSFNEVYEGKFTRKFETYLADHFPARDFFVGVNCDTQLLLQKKDAGGVYFGRNHHLFEKLEQPNPQILSANLAGIAALTKKVQVPIYFMPVPSSAQEMKGSLPANAPSYDQNISMKEIESSLPPQVTVVNVMDVLKPASDEDYYFKTDHHWNAFGAYKGYQALMYAMKLNPVLKDDIVFKKVSSDFYGTLYSKAGYKFQQPDDFYIPLLKTPQKITCCSSGEKTDSVFFMPQLKTKDKYSVFLGGNHNEDIIKNQAAKGGKVLIIKDSFAHSMVPYLTDNFSEIHLVDLRYFHDDLIKYIRDNRFDNIIILYSIKQLDEVVTLGNIN